MLDAIGPGLLSIDDRGGVGDAPDLPLLFEGRNRELVHAARDGRSHHAVQVVRASAKADRAQVDEFRPRPPQFTIIDEVVAGEQPKLTTLRPPRTSLRNPRNRQR